eukprot:4185366-Pyramimonas_sp.AAC.1
MPLLFVFSSCCSSSRTPLLLLLLPVMLLDFFPFSRPPDRPPRSLRRPSGAPRAQGRVLHYVFPQSFRAKVISATVVQPSASHCELGVWGT